MKRKLDCSHKLLTERIVGNYVTLREFLNEAVSDNIISCPKQSFIQEIAEARPKNNMKFEHVAKIVDRISMYKDPFENLRDICDVYAYCDADIVNAKSVLEHLSNQISALTQNDTILAELSV